MDHIDPKSNGGADSKDNLITACFDCNRGKSDKLLSVAPQTLAEKSLIIAEKMEQLKEFSKLKRNFRKFEDAEIKKIEKIFSDAFTEYEFTDSFRESCRRFMEQLPAEDLVSFMKYACSKMYFSPTRAQKYFCGICWNRIREGPTNG